MTDPALYTTLLLAAAAVMGTSAAVTWARARNTPCCAPAVVGMLAISWWSFCYALFWAKFPAPSQYFWLDISYVGIVTIPPSFLVMALCFTNRQHLLTRPVYALLMIEPLLVLSVLFTDHGDGLFFAGQRQGTVIYGAGPVFWAHIVYGQVLSLTVFLLLAREFFRVSGLYKRQLFTLFLGMQVPRLATIVTLTDLNPYPGLGLTPFAFAISGIFVIYALLRYQFLDVVPVARHALVERMSDGMFVLDAKNRVVDANPAAAQLLGADPAALIGQPVAATLSRWPELVERYRDVASAEEEILLTGAAERFLELRLVPLRDRDGALTGRLVVMRDSTERRRAELALREVNTQLQNQLNEITMLQDQLSDQAVRDPLTGLFNRRYLEETLARELSRAARSGEAVSVAVIDVDYFKQINDTCGHHAGDRVLQDIAALLTSSVRSGDVVSRYGGDEFVVVLLGVTLAQARQRAEAWRASCEQYRLNYEGHELHASLSIGLADSVVQGLNNRDLLRAADQALYLAKQAGRNRVATCPLRQQVTLSSPHLIFGASQRN